MPDPFPTQAGEPSAGLPTVLLTGFDPFGGDDVNPSWLAVQTLQGDTIAGHRVVAAMLPTVFAESLLVLRRLVALHRPALVVCVGQAGGRAGLSLERVAINVRDARIADNAGDQPIDEPVVKGGPAAYFTTLPIKAMLQALKEAGVEASVSQTAGTFVCNHVFYGLLHLAARQTTGSRLRGGLIHVPWLPAQGVPSMAPEEVARGLRVALQCALETKRDIHQSAGALD